MKVRSALLCAAVAAALAPAASAGPLGDLPRIRPLNEKAVALVAEARQQSPTVRDIMKTLEDGDVVVYVQVVPAAEGLPLSTLRFVGASKFARFVLVQVADCQKPCRKMELLGHELQHAADVVAANWVNDDGRLQLLLARTGWVDAQTARGYETATAMKAERHVGREVRGVTRPVQ